ncbi:MAG: 30S ribosomal protein S12 methylthiotransferase RimO [Treponema sp.]|jgi:ribosomal protein S12 methylthiotransferase|nr:30S ribosomal protein S12 methylthiotransferase RimO [Treponema sp.]
MRYFLDPFGCVKNQVDAENMMAHLNKEGWENVSEAEQADLIIVNSCGFIESAKRESIDAVLEWRKLYPSKKILLAGCLAQRYAKELSESMPEADDFFGVDNLAQITQIATNLINGGKNANLSHNAALSAGERPLLSLPGSAYVKISEGCNNRCSFCAIPLIRGHLVSRTIPDILEECNALLDRGIKELCVIGQDIGAFGTDAVCGANMDTAAKLPELLEAISSIKGKEHFWVRLLYIHPDHFPLQILDIMERDSRFLPYFDIPFQHSSAKILTAMNRHGNAEKYLALLKTIRARLPNAVIRSTFLLGFPGETDEDFAELLDFQEKANLDWLGCFVYSREEGTTAYPMKKRVPVKIAEKRKQIIEERQIPITEKNMDRFVSQNLEVLIEEQIAATETGTNSVSSEESETLWLGRLYCQAPDIDGAAVIVKSETSKSNPQPGTFVKCRVISRRGFDLEVRV